MLPKTSFATTVVVNDAPAVCGVPAVVETAKWSSAAGSTVTEAFPVIEPSVNVTVRLPAVRSVTLRALTPRSPAWNA